MAHRTSPQCPEWVKSAAFYQIFPDRFKKSDRQLTGLNLEAWDASPTFHGFKGGDLYGATERLDYLQDLGINAVYFTPIFSSTANHRYHTHEYFEVDPLLGGDEAFRQFLEAAHARDMKVVIDGVFNHASRSFFPFNHTLENGPLSPYKDWFYFDQDWLKSGRPLNAYPQGPSDMKDPGHEDPEGLKRFGYRCWWGLPALPKLNTSNPEVREYIYKVAQHWIEMGADGWRLDVPLEIPDREFWQEFRQLVKAKNPDAYIVAEIWHAVPEWLTGDTFDAVMNYALGMDILGYFLGDSLNREVTHNNNYNRIEALSTDDFVSRIQHLQKIYPQEVQLAQMNIMGSHDTPRLLTLASGQRGKLWQALAFMMSFIGAPTLYYGDEIGMEGAHDPDCRRGFPEDPNQGDMETFNFVKKWLALRKEHKTLREGTCDVGRAGESVFVDRKLGSDRIVTYFNQKDSSILVPPQDLGPLKEGHWKNLWTGQNSEANQGLTIESESFAILHRQ